MPMPSGVPVSQPWLPSERWRAAVTVDGGGAWPRWLVRGRRGWSTRCSVGSADLTRRTLATEDPRYTEFLEDDSTAEVVVKVFVTQGLAQLVVSAPIQLAAASRLPRSQRRWLAPIGLAIMVTGAVIEALADRQKSRYAEQDDDEKPDVLDTGLWGWSRHPNYLGDSLVWDGAWLTAAASAPGALTLPAPILMSYLLMFATGAKRTETRMQDRPGYPDYQTRVAFFFPRPRKRWPGLRQSSPPWQ
jgi:steroid 5-alpha reductase family enzyme